VAVYVCALTPTRARRRTSGRAVENIGRVVKRGWKKKKTKPEKRGEVAGQYDPKYVDSHVWLGPARC
jgi:hypothetical protein